MRYEKHFYEGRNSGLQYYEIRNDLKPLVLLHPTELTTMRIGWPFRTG